jgi:hypothetical protein
MSQAGLKALTSVSMSSSTPPADAEDGKDNTELDVCPQCATKYGKRTDVRVINPDEETEERMRDEMEARRAVEKAAKKSKKRKADVNDADSKTSSKKEPVEDSALSKAQSSAKKARTDSSTPTPSHAPTLNPSIAAASRAVVSSLAMEEAKRKANMSDAVKSLYESKNKGVKETFMTRGTFTRVSSIYCSIRRFNATDLLFSLPLQYA